MPSKKSTSSTVSSSSSKDVSVVDVHLTRTNSPSISIQDMVAWLRRTSMTKVTSLEDLKSGEAFCMIIHRLYPKCLLLRSIKRGAVEYTQYLANYRVLQRAFIRLKIRHDFKISHLILKTGAVWEFAQWFKLFYQTNTKHMRGSQRLSSCPSRKPVARVKASVPDPASGPGPAPVADPTSGPDWSPVPSTPPPFVKNIRFAVIPGSPRTPTRLEGI